MLDTDQDGIENRNCYTHFHAQFSSGGTFILDTQGQPLYSYADLHHRSGQYANLLTRMGLKPGDRVMVQVEKTAECLFVYFACLRAKLIYLPLNTAYGRDEVAYFVENAAPALVICAPNVESMFKQLLPETCQLATLDSRGAGSLTEALVAGNDSPKFETPLTQANDVAVILYTSGTTGQPKGAMITHQNLVSNAQTLHSAWGWQHGDVLLHALPIYHIHGLFVATHLAVFNASPILFLPTFDPALIVELLPKATVYMGVPTHYVRLLKQSGLDHAACRKMRLFTSGSAPLLPQTFTAFEAATGHRILERYGMTETGMNTSNPLKGERKPGTVGPALPGVQARIVDSLGNPTDGSAAGELQIRGPNVFKGYWRMPAKTREEFTADGYFKTGDLAQLDAEGYVAIVGRSKDMIISGGLNVYPKEIESVIDKLPGVVESAVIGVHDSDFGEAVTAIVISLEPRELTEVDIINYLKHHLANFKIPKRVHFLPALPRNTMGKVQKNVLREQFKQTPGPE